MSARPQGSVRSAGDAPAAGKPAPEEILPPPDRRPRHVAIIMDGNRRWASARDLLPVEGHREGAEAVRRTTRAAARWDIEHLTLYAFSAENWARSAAEVEALMDLLADYLVSERDEIMENDIRLRGFGQLDRLPDRVLERLRETEAMSADNPGMVLRLALSYGGKQEIVRAARELCRRATEEADGSLEVDEDVFRSALHDPAMPDADLIVRTGGERRLSNFLLFQASYAELLFTEVLWPEFGDRHLAEALASFAGRVRRFGRG